MRVLFTCIATIVVLSTGMAVEATEYSFENVDSFGPDGFFGLGATVTQEPIIGVTHLENSMKYTVGDGGFVGARTESILPDRLNDPPGVTHILFDLTLTEAYPGSFADIGITVFGHAMNAVGGPEFGHQVQFADTESIAALGVGTHYDLRIDLAQSVGSYRPGESFNDIFGPGPTDLTVASAFQFFISHNSGVPLTVYIDNVRVVPEPSTLALTGIGALALLACGLRRRVRPKDPSNA